MSGGIFMLTFTLKILTYTSTYVAVRLLVAQFLRPGLAGSWSLSDPSSAEPIDLDIQLVEAQLRYRLPIRYGDSTELVSVHHTGKVLTYEYVLHTDHPIVNLSLLESDVRAHACRSHSVMSMIANGVTLDYIYWQAGDSTQPLAEISLDRC